MTRQGSTTYPIVEPVLDRIARWCRGENAREHLTVLDTLNRAELAQLAEDMRVSTMQLRLLLSCSPGLAEFLARHMAVLLAHRMEALHIDADDLARADPKLLQALRRRCAACDCRARCEQDLLHDPQDPVWRDYCPNAQVLEALPRVA
ncbi:MAG TPA: hypothetical protein VG985_03630 [Xanthobacteraceae bacterium]|nr:hypothetical protein [Xanthobacteraceae bacterium]